MMIQEFTEYITEHIGAAVNEGLKLGVPPLVVCSVLDLLKLELQTRMLEMGARPDESPLIVLPKDRRNDT